MSTQNTPYNRINITLPKSTLELLDKVSLKRSRSRFIDMAVKSYVYSARRSQIKKALTEAGIKRNDRDLEIANAFALLENYEK